MEKGDYMDINNFFAGKSYVGVQGVWKEGNIPCFILNIYAPCDLEEKRKLWPEIVEPKNQVKITYWCLADDFNSVRTMERRRDNNNVAIGGRDMNTFNKFTRDLEVEDISLVGKSYTW